MRGLYANKTNETAAATAPPTWTIFQSFNTIDSLLGFWHFQRPSVSLRPPSPRRRTLCRGLNNRLIIRIVVGRYIIFSPRVYSLNTDGLGRRFSRSFHCDMTFFIFILYCHCYYNNNFLDAWKRFTSKTRSTWSLWGAINGSLRVRGYVTIKMLNSLSIQTFPAKSLAIVMAIWQQILGFFFFFFIFFWTRVMRTMRVCWEVCLIMLLYSVSRSKQVELTNKLRFASIQYYVRATWYVKYFPRFKRRNGVVSDFEIPTIVVCTHTTPGHRPFSFLVPEIGGALWCTTVFCEKGLLPPKFEKTVF